MLVIIGVPIIEADLGDVAIKINQCCFMILRFLYFDMNIEHQVYENKYALEI